jgi:hypothetical protein
MKQKGFIGNLLIGVVIFIFIAVIAGAQYWDNKNAENAFNEMKVKRPTVSIEMKKAVDTYGSMPTPTKKPQGEYINSGVIEGKPAVTRYYFSLDNQVFKEVTVSDKYLMSGSAKYEYRGSVMQFSDIKGDLFLFSEIGEPLRIISDSEIENPNIGVLMRKKES